MANPVEVVEDADLSVVLRNFVGRLSRDIRKAAVTLSDAEVRFLVDYYYQMQDDRIAHAGRIRSIGDSEPHEVLTWLETNSRMMENAIKSALDSYTMSSAIGIWCRSICGIGPVIAAGLLAHIDIKKAPTAGHIYGFAGLNPSVKWEKGQKRPHNADLKRLCWLIGESFVKMQGRESDFYGKQFYERKRYEVEKNDAGGNVAEATRALGERRYERETGAKLWYTGCYPAGTTANALNVPAEKREAYLKSVRLPVGEGQQMLPPAHVHARAKRWTVKLFLSHLQHVWWTLEFGAEPPHPYAISILDHAHYIPPPNFP